MKMEKFGRCRTTIKGHVGEYNGKIGFREFVNIVTELFFFFRNYYREKNLLTYKVYKTIKTKQRRQDRWA